jgi:hypothetical protein
MIACALLDIFVEDKDIHTINGTILLARQVQECLRRRRAHGSPQGLVGRVKNRLASFAAGHGLAVRFGHSPRPPDQRQMVTPLTNPCGAP